MADETEALKRTCERSKTKDPSSGIFWGILFIYAGLLCFLVEWNFIYGDEWFSFFLLGLGIIMIGEYLIRQFVESVPKCGMAKLIFGLIFLVIGSNHIFYLEDWWPLLLVLVGGFMIWSAFRRKQVKLSS